MMRENMRKSVKERILFTLSLGRDVFSVQEFLPFHYEDIYWLLQDVKQTTVRCTVAELVKSHLISTYRHDGKTWFVLSMSGKEYLLSKIRMYKARRSKWDQMWRMVVFAGIESFPKAYRLLRSTLMKNGFVQIERGVYVSPYAISESLHTYMVSHNMVKCSLVVETKRFLFGDERVYANMWWNLESIASEYTKIGSRVRELLKSFKTKKRLNNKEKESFSKIVLRAFVQIIEDPGVPLQLLPSNWEFEEVYNRFIELSSTIFSQRK